MAETKIKIAPMGSALQRAQSIQPGSDVPWQALETDACIRFPPLARLLSPDGYQLKTGRWMSLWFVVRGIGIVVGFILFAVVWYFPGPLGVLAMSEGAPAATGPMFAARFAIPAAAVVYAWTSVTIIVRVIWLTVKGYNPSLGGLAQGFTVGTFIICGVSVPWMRSRGIRSDVPWGTAAIVAGVAALIAAGHFTVLTVFRTRRIRWSHQPGELPTKPSRTLARQVRRLTPQQQDGISADVAAAIDDLQNRQVISADEADVARAAELGALGHRMSVWRRQRDHETTGPASPSTSIGQ